MVPLASHEELAKIIDDLHGTIRELEEQNGQLRKAAFEFGALADRLNARLIAQRRTFARGSLNDGKGNAGTGSPCCSAHTAAGSTGYPWATFLSSRPTAACLTKAMGAVYGFAKSCFAFPLSA